MSDETIKHTGSDHPLPEGVRDDTNIATILLTMLFSSLLVIVFVIGVMAYFHREKNALTLKKAALAVNQSQSIIQRQKADLAPHWVNQKRGTATMGIELAMDEVVHQANPGSPSPLLVVKHKVVKMATAPGKAKAEPLSVMGKKLYATMGCIGCHTVNGTPGVGPTWKNLAGYPEHLTNGKTVIVDYKFLRTMILHPGKLLVKGAPAGVMPDIYYAQLAGKKHPHETKLNALIWYINTLSNKSSKATQPPVPNK